MPSTISPSIPPTPTNEQVICIDAVEQTITSIPTISAPVLETPIPQAFKAVDKNGNRGIASFFAPAPPSDGKSGVKRARGKEEEEESGRGKGSKKVKGGK